jgi:hypothetical protein
MWLIALLVLQEAPPAERIDPPVSLAPPTWLKGSLSLRYRHRRTSDAEDSDLYQFLQLRADGDRVGASLSVRFAEDLDRPSGEPGYFPFDSLDDTYSPRTARLYTAYVDVRLDTLHLRGGRQILEELPEALPFDGGLVRALAVEDVEVALFGGLPVNLFESSPDGDLTYGGWAAARPWSRGRLRVEVLHLEDETAFGAFDDDLLGASFEQSAGPVLFSGRQTWLEGEAREAVGRASGLFGDFIVDLRVRYAYERQQAMSYALDPFATFMMEVEPHLDLGARVSKAFGRHVALDAAVTERRLVRGGEEGLYNHEFTRWTAAPRLDFEAVSLAGAVDYWDSDADDFWTVGGDLVWRFWPDWAAGLGSGYALYTIDALTGEERERVRTYYATLRWTLGGAARLDLRFTLEENELDTFRVVELGVRHVF